MVTAQRGAQQIRGRGVYKILLNARAVSSAASAILVRFCNQAAAALPALQFIEPARGLLRIRW
jgi:hypothetical protein